LNAAILAVQILAVNDDGLRTKLEDYKKGLADKVERADKKVVEESTKL